MKFKFTLLVSLLVLLAFTGNAQVNRDDINGNWSTQDTTLYNTAEAAVMVRVGDIDNLGFGWPNNFDPFSGATTPSHAYPFQPGAGDYDGTDRIMVVTSYNGTPPHGQDGYTSGTTRPENLPRPIILNYNLNGTTVTSAALQIFVDDFQAPVWYAHYTATLNQVELPALSMQCNTLVQTGPRGKLITVAIPASLLAAVSSGTISLLIDDLTTGAGDGYAIDFVKLLVNPTDFAYVGTITGTVTEKNSGNPIAGASVSASGIANGTTDAQGNYTIENVPAGYINVSAAALGYQTNSGFVDVVGGQTATLNLQLDFAIIPECDTLHYPLAGTPTLFYVSPPEAGYVSGNNTYGDVAKADYFDPAETGKYVYKGLFEFAYVAKGSGQNPDIEFRVWNSDGSGGKPGTTIGTATLKLNDIFDDVVAMGITEVEFDPPVLVDGPFYLGVMLPMTAGDTLALISTDDGEINPGISYELWPDNNWYAFSDASSWQLNLGQAIYAQYCDLGFGVKDITDQPFMNVYPNPARDRLNIELDYRGKIEISLCNFLGATVNKWSVNSSGDVISLPLEGLSEGMYLLHVTGPGLKTGKKVIIR